MKTKTIGLLFLLLLIVVANILYHTGFFEEKRDPLADFEYFVKCIDSETGNSLGNVIVKQVKYDVRKTESLSNPIVATLFLDTKFTHNTTVGGRPYSFTVDSQYTVNFSWTDNIWHFNEGVVIKNTTRNDGTKDQEIEKISDYDDLTQIVKTAYYELRKHQGADTYSAFHLL